MALIPITLLSAFCTLMAVICVVFFDVRVLLILQIYLGLVAVLVFFGVIASLILPIGSSGNQSRTRRIQSSLPNGPPSSHDVKSSQTPQGASIVYARLMTEYQKLGPIQSAAVKSRR